MTINVVNLIKVPDKESFTSAEQGVMLIVEVLLKARKALVEQGLVMLVDPQNRKTLLIDRNRNDFTMAEVKRWIDDTGHYVSIVMVEEVEKLDWFTIEHPAPGVRRDWVDLMRKIVRELRGDYDGDKVASKRLLVPSEDKRPHLERGGFNRWNFKKGKR